MKTIYLIQVKTTWSDGKTSINPIYAVGDEKTAKADCNKMQTRFNGKNYEDFKEFYFFTKIHYYK